MTEIISNLDVTGLSSTELTIDNPIGHDNPPLLTPNINDVTDIPLTQHALQLSDFDVNWEDRLTDIQLDQLVNNGWIIIDDVFKCKALLALQAESGFIDYRDAQLTTGIRVSDIRGDKIRWITPDLFAGYYYLQSINELALTLNRSLFAGIRHSEAHYACYPIGFGYHWHSDNPAGRNERVISAVFYLNDEWATSDGGALEVVDNHGKPHNVMPVANRLIIFDSNLQHQVQIAHRQRYSIATWMRRDGLVPFIEDS
ncbi:2OG-Fe(II) oxygenase [Psychrobacter frigidicola]|uniref:2OG-Fe(II) oxygenase n=1 Tax=Psychrobacter frigidicola TaxID=45611 RepID=A0A5C7A0I4_9GAMM|nr:2OG-Fe(II) oxygenase [Psychrobacter frigidicola]TXD96636.1 2OG-Fe(II) oxygenase [Psychrobacter frigidicola]